ncbi:MAG: trypsin-like serine protease [Ruminococcaceae bacterium]|nr:trypsin-like serine protease [Oscillospiraceae bacterium]
MDEYKWNNDDYQNDVTSDSFEDTQSNDCFSTVVAPKKKSKKKVAMPVFIFTVIFTMIISISAYALLAPSVRELVENIQQKSGTAKLNSEEKELLENIANIAPGVDKSSGKAKLEIPDIAEKVGPAVVGVVNLTKYSGYSYNNPFGFYFQQPDMQNVPEQEVEQGSGSGILISADGYIITNNHVVEGASSLKVILNTGEKYDAVLKGADARTDLALLKIEGNGFPFATLGDSTTLRVGDLAVAIGNPLGQELAGTVTVGYISALNRTMTIDNKQLTLIQTDAAINPGNSGGALVNCYGEVIGINTAKVSSSSLEGLGFAIPTAEAKPIIEDLISNGYVKGRPVIGIAGRGITAKEAQAYNMVEGVYVYSMTESSPAYMSGIKIGDIIVECNGTKVKTVDELNDIKNKFKPNDTLRLKLWRSGSYVNVNLILGEEVPGN